MFNVNTQQRSLLPNLKTKIQEFYSELITKKKVIQEAINLYCLWINVFRRIKSFHCFFLISRGGKALQGGSAKSTGTYGNV